MSEAALSRQSLKSKIAINIGNTMEWFDNAVYGYLAVPIARAVFPDADPRVGVMLTLGTFAVSFFVRPFGAIVLGAYADRSGRKPALVLSMALMSVGTLVIAAVPPFQQI